MISISKSIYCGAAVVVVFTLQSMKCESLNKDKEFIKKALKLQPENQSKYPSFFTEAHHRLD